jgi:4-hydroxy-3-polyprenylbenzoate decarboxylase
MKLLLSIGGASGSIYGIRLLEELVNAGVEVHLIVSEGAKKIMAHETETTYDTLQDIAHTSYENNDLFAPPASGSYPLDGMIIIPCSMKTLASVAHGLGDTLTSRAASCQLKEGRPLILVVRETPLDTPGLYNMLQAKRSGAVILPAMPGFYHKPQDIDDLVNFIVGKVLDQLHVPHSLFQRWG